MRVDPVTTLHIRQDAPRDGRYPIRLTLKRPGQPDQEAQANIELALSGQEQEDLRWYLEDYLQHAEAVETVAVQQVERLMKDRGEELYTKVLAANAATQALWFSIRNDLANLRVEIATGIAEAASIPWELMRDPEMDSPVSLRVRSFVRVQSNPNISFVPVPPAPDGRVRLLYAACRPRGPGDVELRAVANRLLQDLGEDRGRFDITALRPPTFEQLQKALTDAKEAGRPYHIVHFDGHGTYADLTKTPLAGWLSGLSNLTLGGATAGKHGYLLFEHPGEDNVRPVDGQTLGQLLHDNGVPVLVLNACQSAMHEATAAPKTVGLPAEAGVPAARSVHEEIRAIGSLAQAVIDQGVPAVLGMRYKVYVVTAAQYIGQLYGALAKGRTFGQAATEGRKHLHLNPNRWVTLVPRPLQDWFVPVAYEAAPLELFPAGQPAAPRKQPELDPVQLNRALLRYVPEEGFVGRDETILALKLGGENKLKPSEIADWQPLLAYCAGNPLTLRVLAGQAIRTGLRGKRPIEDFVQAIRLGEQSIEDTDEKQGRDKSPGASLDYGFRNAFKDDELPIVALLHLFQGTVDVDVLQAMSRAGDYALPELQGTSKEQITALLQRAKETGLLAHLHATWFNIHPALPWFLRQLFARHYDGRTAADEAKTQGLLGAISQLLAKLPE